MGGASLLSTLMALFLSNVGIMAGGEVSVAGLNDESHQLVN
jgi:hypothetical protein